MRRRLILLASAVTLMVALAFVVPLAFLVRDLAADRAIAAGERRAEDVARIIATLAPERGIEVATSAVLLGPSDDMDTSLLLPDGTVVGAPLVAEESPDLAVAGTAFRSDVAGGDVIYTPVIQPDGSALVVRVFVPDSEIPMEISACALIPWSRSERRPPQPNASRSSGTLVCHWRIWSACE